MTNKEKFLKLVAPETTNTLDKVKWRNANRAWLQASNAISIKVIERLEELGWSQKRLAQEMKVTPQYVNKIVKGNENLTLDTIVKLQEILDIPLLASHYEDMLQTMQELVLELKEVFSYKPAEPIENNYTNGKVLTLTSDVFSYEFEYKDAI